MGSYLCFSLRLRGVEEKWLPKSSVILGAVAAHGRSRVLLCMQQMLECVIYVNIHKTTIAALNNCGHVANFPVTVIVPCGCAVVLLMRSHIFILSVMRPM